MSDDMLAEAPGAITVDQTVTLAAGTYRLRLEPVTGPPPPAPVTITDATNAAGQSVREIVVGQSVFLKGTNFTLQPVLVAKLGTTPTMEMGRTGTMLTVMPVQPVGLGGKITLTDAHGLVVATSAFDFTVRSLPPGPVGDTVNARDKGAKGDGATDDAPALQRALDGLKAGQKLYLPPGNYKCGLPLYVNVPNTGVLGDGETSIITHGAHQGLYIKANAAHVHKLCLVGLPGVYHPANTAHGILIDGGDGVHIQEVKLRGPGNGIYAIHEALNTIIDTVMIHGWGGVGLGLGGSCVVKNCALIQDNPNRATPNHHGIYIYSGASDVKIQDTLIQNARGLAIHLYGQTVGMTTGPIELTRVRWVDCREGFLSACFPQEASRCHDVVLTACEAVATYDGRAYSVRQGSRVKLVNCKAIGGGIGFSIGGWADWEPGAHIEDVSVTGCEAEGCSTGFWPLASNGGKMTNVVIGPGNKAVNCAFPIRANATPGLTVHPFA